MHLKCVLYCRKFAQLEEVYLFGLVEVLTIAWLRSPVTWVRGIFVSLTWATGMPGGTPRWNRRGCSSEILNGLGCSLVLVLIALISDVDLST